jgi:alpha-tubulin suppressor-like RCC1 family protein
MAIIKCKMCGGDLAVQEGMTVAECEYCGTKQTVPTVDNEKKITLFGRAGRLLRACEFDKAAGVFESIVAEFPEEAEAYWGLVLCKFGIEYVDDPATGKKVPTCHRSSFDSIFDDSNFEQACENADVVARGVYRSEAKTIEELRKGIIEVSAKEEPYDVFISYKEKDESGERTIDSVIAQDIYTELTDKGYRVFFSRISLEDKLGVEYEPYIFAALNSAKLMLVVGTNYDNFEAVWVKNEWSRFLSLMASGQKKTLIPCFKDIDAYDMPKEFNKLAAQDMGKVGAMQDLARGVEKILGGNKETITSKSDGTNLSTLLERGNMALEDGNWGKAVELFEKSLNIDCHNAKAYLGLAMADNHCHDIGDFKIKYTACMSTLPISANIKRMRQFGDRELLGMLSELDAEATKMSKVLDLISILSQIKNTKKIQVEQEQERIRAEKARLRCMEARHKIKPVASMIDLGYSHSVALRVDGTVVATGENYDGQCDVSKWKNIVSVAAGKFHTVGLRADGTVVATGENRNGQCDVSKWKDIVSIAARDNHTIGLRADGTVVATGENRSGQCDVSEWQNVVSIAAGKFHTVGLHADGTVVATGDKGHGQCDVSKWKDIVSIAVSSSHTVGLSSDGTVIATGDNGAGQCNYMKGKNIVSIAAGEKHTVGLCSDGTVVATGDKGHGQCNVSEWKDIVSIAAEENRTVGLCLDGTVVATGNNSSGQCNVMEWKEIVSIAVSSYYTVGLRSDGTVVATGYNKDGQCNVEGWKLFENYETIDAERKAAEERAAAERKAAEERAAAERKAAEERAEAERKAAAEKAERERQEKIAKLNAEKASLQDELASLKGLFSGKRRKEIEARLAEIGKELEKLN